MRYKEQIMNHTIKFILTLSNYLYFYEWGGKIIIWTVF